MAISYIAALTGVATTGGTFNISRPTGSSQDDIILATISASSSGAIGAFTWPGGWNVVQTQEGTAGTAVHRVEIAWHVYATGETNYSVTVPTLTSGTRTHITATYRGCDTTTPWVSTDLSAIEGDGVSGAITSDSLSSSVSNLWAIGAFFAHTSSANFSFAPGTGLTERQDRTNTTGTYRTGIEVADTNGTIDASGGVSYSATPSGTTYNRCAFLGLLQPPAAPGGSPLHSCGILLG